MRIRDRYLRKSAAYHIAARTKNVYGLKSEEEAFRKMYDNSGSSLNFTEWLNEVCGIR